MDFALGLLCLTLGFCVLLAIAQRRRELASMLLVGFTLRAALTILDSFVYQLPGAGDGVGWNLGAVYMARDGLLGTVRYIDTGPRFYMWLMSVLYALLAPSALMIKGINVFFGTLMIKSSWDLSMMLGKQESRARIVAWTMALCPSLVFFSAVLLREVAVAYPLILSILYLTRWYADRKNIYLFGAITTLLISMIFHSGSFAVLVFGGLWVIGNWFRSILTGRFAHFGRNTLALVLGVGVVLAVLSSGFGLEKFNGIDTSNMDTLTGRQEGFAHGRAAYLEDLHASSPVDLIWQAPIRATYFLFAPFPWMISTGSDAFGLIDSAIFAFLVVHAVRHRKALAKQPQIVLVLGVFAAMAAVFALGVSNYGTALRHRDKMLPLLLAAVVSIPVERQRRDRIPFVLPPRVQPRGRRPMSAPRPELSPAAGTQKPA